MYKVYNVFIFSFPKQYCTAQLSYVITWVHIKILCKILFVQNNVHVQFNSAFRSSLSSISSWKWKETTSFQILFILVFSVSLKGPLDSMLCITGFDSVLGGVKGVVYSVVFAILSNLVKFTLDAIVGMTTFGSNSYLVFSR